MAWKGIKRFSIEAPEPAPELIIGSSIEPDESEETESEETEQTEPEETESEETEQTEPEETESEETEPETDDQEQSESEQDMLKSISKLEEEHKKDELIEMAESLGLESSGTKADISKRIALHRLS